MNGKDVFHRVSHAEERTWGRTGARASLRLVTVFVVLLLTSSRLLAAEVMPPAPQNHFNDYAGVVSPAAAQQFNKTLEDFERETSSQILVVVYPKMQSDSSIEDYTVRVAQSWGVGQKSKNNGAVLFVFIQDRKMFLQVGYGLEGALPDAVAHQIIDNEIKPRFKVGDYEGGLRAGIAAILAATKGEYKGTGQTVADSSQQHSGGSPLASLLFFGFFALFLLLFFFRRRGGYRGGYYGGWTYGGGGYWGGGGGFSGGGGGGFSGGGGSFSGGGGSFGGGGAGGSW